MKEYSLISKIEHLVFLGNIFTLDRAARDLVKLDGVLRKMDASNAWPQAAQDNRLQQVLVVTISVESRR